TFDDHFGNSGKRASRRSRTALPPAAEGFSSPSFHRMASGWRTADVAARSRLSIDRKKTSIGSFSAARERGEATRTRIGPSPILRKVAAGVIYFLSAAVQFTMTFKGTEELLITGAFARKRSPAAVTSQPKSEPSGSWKRRFGVPARTP